MRAVAWKGMNRVQVEDYQEPRVVTPRDAVLDVEATAICGSDLHLYHGFVPKVRNGDILGHEFIGSVRELGEDVETLNEGDRVVVPFPISCGTCANCRAGAFAKCETTNHGHGAAIFGYSHLYGGVPGGQAESVRVPFADVGPVKIPDDVTDDQAVLLSDILPTAYQACLQGEAAEGKSVVVYGLGPVGLLTVQCAKRLFNADTVIGVDRVPARLRMAEDAGADEVLDFSEATDPATRVRALTDGKGADVSIDAVGFEASSPSRVASGFEKMAGALTLQTGSLTALRWATESVRFGGNLSVPGVYAAYASQNFPWNVMWERGLTVKGGQTDVQAHIQYLADVVADGTLDPSFIVTHHGDLEEAPDLYKTFDHKTDDCVKCVLTP